MLLSRRILAWFLSSSCHQCIVTIHTEHTLRCSRVSQILYPLLTIPTPEASGAVCMISCENGEILYFVSTSTAAVCAIITDQWTISQEQQICIGIEKSLASIASKAIYMPSMTSWSTCQSLPPNTAHWWLMEAYLAQRLCLLPRSIAKSVYWQSCRNPRIDLPYKTATFARCWINIFWIHRTFWIFITRLHRGRFEARVLDHFLFLKRDDLAPSLAILIHRGTWRLISCPLIVGMRRSMYCICRRGTFCLSDLGDRRLLFIRRWC